MNNIRELDQTKHHLDQILENQKASDDVKRLVYEFHSRLLAKLDANKEFTFARTNSIGITYFCNPKKAFIFLSVNQQFLTLKCFTGEKSINGIGKGIWINKNDNHGSTPFRIPDNKALQQALDLSVEAFNIASDW
jgi:hypothetical protein